MRDGAPPVRAATAKGIAMPERPRRALLAVNRRSLQGNGEISDCLDRLRGQGILLSVHPTDRPDDVPALIREHHGGHDLVILGGGDGTMNLAAEALVEAGLPLGILPLGTANDLARTLGIPFKLAEACDVIATGVERWIDLGRVNGKAFFNVASLGLGVAVQQVHKGERKRRWKVLSYVFSVIEAFDRSHSFSVEITCDGRTERLRCLHLAVGNGRHYGGGMTIAQDATIDDGTLDLYALRPQSLASLMLLAPVLRWGLHSASERQVCMRGREFEVRTRHPKRINADGEIVSETPAKFTVAPRALRVIVPADRPAPGLETD
jgi:YegS/Rv2252/BmrU family lipid kinase